MAKGSITTLYFDVISPYSWIAFESLLRYEKHLPTKLILRPVFLGGIMQGSGNKPPATIPNKAKYMVKDLECNNRYWGLKIRQPSDFLETIIKRGSLQAQRFLTVVDQKNPEYLRPAALELWNRVWSEDKPIHEAQNIKEVCNKIKIPNADKLIEEIGSQKIKDALKKNTEEALESGAFGAPWIILKREGKDDVCFFGSDRLPLLCYELNVNFQGPLK